MRPMLCKTAPADFLSLKYPLAAEIKYDGVRCLASVKKGKITLYSRNGKPLLNFEEIKATIPYKEDVIFDGEVISPKGFQALMTRTHAEQGKNTDILIEYKIFDKILPQEWINGYSTRTYEERCIKAAIGERVIIKNPTDLRTYFDAVIKAGHEGLIVKALNSTYEPGKSSQWLKIKPYDTMDLTIVDCIEGLGKYAGMLGCFVCEGKLEDGSKVFTDVGSGFTDEQRQKFWEDRIKLVGITVEIEYQEITQQDRYGDKSLRFPIFKCLRLDK